MNRTYIIKGHDILELSDNIDVFNQKIEPFLRKHPEYKFKLDLYHDEEYWVVKITIDNGTGEKETFREFIKSS